MAKKHGWGSEGEKRTIAVPYKPSQRILKYLVDMRGALVMALSQGYILAKNDYNKVPSPIALRRKVKPWFDSACGVYAKHHVNPVCRAAVALLRAYKKRNKRLGLPQIRKLPTRIDSELFKVREDDDGTLSVRITLEPFNYEYITFTPRHKKWSEYSAARVSEILLTDTKLCFAFTMGVDDRHKPLGKRFMGLDLDFETVDSSAFSGGGLESPWTEQLRKIVRVQNDFSRRRRRLQLHIRNPKKRYRMLTETRGRQRNRVKDMLHKMSTRIVRENMDTTFVLENLRGIRVNNREEQLGTTSRSKKLRMYLNRWPYRMFQSMVEYKSRCRTLYVSPRGTSLECPVCGGRLEHPAWAVSHCENCGVDYDRDRLASLAILLRGLRLCGQPFAVSASASWQSVRNEYLYAPGGPEAGRAGWTRDCQRTE
nr:transposase [Candidatus Njordarchaeota archaeon]